MRRLSASLRITDSIIQTKTLREKSFFILYRFEKSIPIGVMECDQLIQAACACLQTWIDLILYVYVQTLYVLYIDLFYMPLYMEEIRYQFQIEFPLFRQKVKTYLQTSRTQGKTIFTIITKLGMITPQRFPSPSFCSVRIH